MIVIRQVFIVSNGKLEPKLEYKIVTKISSEE